MKCFDCDGKGKFRSNGLIYDEKTGEVRLMRKLRGVLVGCRTCDGKGEVELYIIRCKSDHNLHWSNIWGWVDMFYDMFTHLEKEKYNLPLDGEWEKFETLDEVYIR